MDDAEATHPKVLALIDAAGYEGYYRLQRLRQWTWRHRTNGRFTDAVVREEGVRPKQLQAMLDMRLVDQNGAGYSIHDAGDYNVPRDTTAAERMRRYRGRNDA